MTRARAIELLKGVQFCCDLDDCTNAWDCEECDDALNMAIETLQHEQERREDIYECPNCLGEVHINYIYCPFCGIKVESDEQ